MKGIRVAALLASLVCLSLLLSYGAAQAAAPCGHEAGCVRQAGPGPADRQVHPFEGSLGRPCAYRHRPTPSGTRKVRVCF